MHSSTTHMLLLELLRCGIGLDQARVLGYEEALCLLKHVRLERQLDELTAESRRVAGQPFADRDEQQKSLSALRHRAATILQRFYEKC